MNEIRPVTIGDATLYCGDMMDVIERLMVPSRPGLATRSIVADAIVTDPPYGIGEAAGKNKSRGKIATAKDYGDLAWDDAPCSADQIAIMRERSIHQIIFGGNYFDLPPSSCWLVWDKQNGDNDFADCELAWTNLKRAVRQIQWRWNGMIRQKTPGGFDDTRVHPTQKPVGMMAWCIDQLPLKNVTAILHDEGKPIILDPFMGSGTTGIAALRAGFRFIGIEREPSYFEHACKRIADAASAPDLFAVTDGGDERDDDGFVPDSIGWHLRQSNAHVDRGVHS